MNDWIIECDFWGDGTFDYRHLSLPCTYGTYYTWVPTQAPELFHTILVWEIAAPGEAKRQVPFPMANMASILSERFRNMGIVPRPMQGAVNEQICSFHTRWSAWDWSHTFDLVLHDAAVGHMRAIRAAAQTSQTLAEWHENLAFHLWIASRQVRSHMADSGGWAGWEREWRREEERRKAQYA